MKSLIMIIIAGALINNVVLNQFLGICSFLRSEERRVGKECRL